MVYENSDHLSREGVVLETEVLSLSTRGDRLRNGCIITSDMEVGTSGYDKFRVHAEWCSDSKVEILVFDAKSICTKIHLFDIF